MVSPTGQLLCVAMFMTVFISNSPAAYTSKDDPIGALEAKSPAPSPSDSYKFVDEICASNSITRDPAFCKKVLMSDPRSATAQKNADVLLISIDSAVAYLNETKEYFTSLLKSHATKAESNQVFKECISDYHVGILELSIIPKDMVDDPNLASYDALLASDNLKYCDNALQSSKIANESILSRHETATSYVWLCVDIALTIY